MSKKKAPRKISVGRKTTESNVTFQRRQREDRYAGVILSLSKNLKRRGDTVPVNVPDDQTPQQFRNALSTMLRRRLPNLPLRFRVLEGGTAVAVIKK